MHCNSSPATLPVLLKICFDNSATFVNIFTYSDQVHHSLLYFEPLFFLSSLKNYIYCFKHGIMTNRLFFHNFCKNKFLCLFSSAKKKITLNTLWDGV